MLFFFAALINTLSAQDLSHNPLCREYPRSGLTYCTDFIHPAVGVTSIPENCNEVPASQSCTFACGDAYYPDGGEVDLKCISTLDSCFTNTVFNQEFCFSCWEDATPLVCAPFICRDLFNYDETIDMWCEGRQDEGYYLGSTCEWSCTDPDRTALVGNSTWNCVQTGDRTADWDQVDHPTCINKECPMLHDLEGMPRIECNGNVWGSICEYSCPEEYQLQGSQKRECLEELGNDWTGVPGECIRNPILRPDSDETMQMNLTSTMTHDFYVSFPVVASLFVELIGECTDQRLRVTLHNVRQDYLQTQEVDCGEDIMFQALVDETYHYILEVESFPIGGSIQWNYDSFNTARNFATYRVYIECAVSCIGTFRDYETLDAVSGYHMQFSALRFCPQLDEDYQEFIDIIGKDPLADTKYLTRHDIAKVVLHKESLPGSQLELINILDLIVRELEMTAAYTDMWQNSLSSFQGDVETLLQRFTIVMPEIYRDLPVTSMPNLQLAYGRDLTFAFIEVLEAFQASSFGRMGQIMSLLQPVIDGLKTRTMPNILPFETFNQEFLRKNRIVNMHSQDPVTMSEIRNFLLDWGMTREIGLYIDPYEFAEELLPVLASMAATQYRKTLLLSFFNDVFQEKDDYICIASEVYWPVEMGNQTGFHNFSDLPVADWYQLTYHDCAAYCEAQSDCVASSFNDYLKECWTSKLRLTQNPDHPRLDVNITYRDNFTYCESVPPGYAGVDVRDLENWETWVSDVWDEFRTEIGYLYGSDFEMSQNLYYYDISSLQTFYDLSVQPPDSNNLNPNIDPFDFCHTKHQQVDPNDIAFCLGCELGYELTNGTCVPKCEYDCFRLHRYYCDTDDPALCGKCLPGFTSLLSLGAANDQCASVDPGDSLFIDSVPDQVHAIDLRLTDQEAIEVKHFAESFTLSVGETWATFRSQGRFTDPLLFAQSLSNEYIVVIVQNVRVSDLGFLYWEMKLMGPRCWVDFNNLDISVQTVSILIIERGHHRFGDSDILVGETTLVGSEEKTILLHQLDAKSRENSDYTVLASITTSANSDLWVVPTVGDKQNASFSITLLPEDTVEVRETVSYIVLPKGIQSLASLKVLTTSEDILENGENTFLGDFHWPQAIGTFSTLRTQRNHDATYYRIQVWGGELQVEMFYDLCDKPVPSTQSIDLMLISQGIVKSDTMGTPEAASDHVKQWDLERQTTTPPVAEEADEEDVTGRVDLLFWIVWAMVSVVFFLAVCAYWMYDKIYANEREWRKGFETLPMGLDFESMGLLQQQGETPGVNQSSPNSSGTKLGNSMMSLRSRSGSGGTQHASSNPRLLQPGSTQHGSHLGIPGASRGSMYSSAASVRSDNEQIIEGHIPQQRTNSPDNNAPRGIYSQRPSIYTFNYRRRSTLTFGSRDAGAE